jgi:ribonuclease HII
MSFNDIPSKLNLASYSKSLDSNYTLIGGVDEAGRGSVLGPLVIAGVSIKRKDLSSLRRVGVRDSKLLTVKTRHKLFSHIIDLAEHICVYESHCDEVDQYVYSNMLNKLEAKAMATVIDNIFAMRVYVDACDVNPLRYKECIECELGSILRPRIFSLHHADGANTAVSAASIIAKVIRDEEIHKIRSQHSDEIGSGYPSDRKTMKFIAKWVAKHNSAPHFARKSWKPLRALLENHRQSIHVKSGFREEISFTTVTTRTVSSMN